MSAAKVSAVIIAFNEAANIERTLRQLWCCDEIIVVDSYSTDDTVSICKRYGCRIFYRRFDGYGTQKQFAVAQARNNMILCIDADEVLTDELSNEIRAEMRNPSADGYLIKMDFVFINKIFEHGKESRKSYIRLFDRTKGNFNSKTIHEGIELDGSTKKLQGKILHYSYKNVAHYFDKFNRYSSLGADLICKKKKQKPLALILVAMPFYFFKYYFIEGNIRNGLPGFYWASFQSFYHFVKYIKVREGYRQMAMLEKEELYINSLVDKNAERQPLSFVTEHEHVFLDSF